MVDNSKKRLLKNTFFLYLLTFSSQVLGLITIPYQTRVLSPEMYGVVGVATSTMTFLSLILDFGLLLSATPKVASHQGDAAYLSELYGGVLAVKAGIATICGVILGAVCLALPYYRQYLALYALYYFAYVLAAMLPDYLYRGLEQMKIITVRTVAIRLFATAGTFIFLKSDADVLALPICLLCGNFAALIACFKYDRVNFAIQPILPSLEYLKNLARSSLPFFFSRVSSTVYSTANPIVLNAFYAGSPVIGLYTASEKFLSVSKSVVSPIADSLYPYMVRNKDYRLVKRVLIFTAPFILIGATVLFTFADQICVLIFGDGYAGAGSIVRCLLPAIMVIVPSYIICFPVLVPMGLSSQANFSNFIGVCVQLFSLALLILTGKLDVYTICMATSAAEVSVFLYRLITILRHRGKKASADHALYR